MMRYLVLSVCFLLCSVSYGQYGYGGGYGYGNLGGHGMYYGNNFNGGYGYNNSYNPYRYGGTQNYRQGVIVAKPNIFGGYNYTDNGRPVGQSRPNIFGGQTYQEFNAPKSTPSVRYHKPAEVTHESKKGTGISSRSNRYQK